MGGDSRDRRGHSADRGRGGGDRGGDRGAGRGRMRGYVVSWHDDKGIGFIKPNEGGEDVFTHVSCLKDGDCLEKGAEVSFEETFDERKGKYRAIEVTGCSQRRDVYPRSMHISGGGGGARRDSRDRSRGRRRRDSRSRSRRRDSRSRRR